MRANLRTSAGVDHLWGQVTTHGRPLDVAALNAGIGVGGGSFVETDLEAHLDVIRLNVLGTVHLAKLIVSDMARRGKGRVLITSSLVAAMPGPYQTTYNNASKSFLKSFAEGLQTELRGLLVTVTSLMPGPVETPFFARAGMSDTVLGRARKSDPDAVARQAYHALRRGKRRVVGGFPIQQGCRGDQHDAARRGQGTYPGIPVEPRPEVTHTGKSTAPSAPTMPRQQD